MRNSGIRLVGISIATAALAVACTANQPGQAQSAASSGRKCFLPSQVNNFDALERDKVLVTIGTSTFYQLDIVGTCSNIDWSNRIGIRSTGGASWVCEGLDAELLVPGARGLERCPVVGVTQLSPEAAQALRQKRN